MKLEVLLALTGIATFVILILLSTNPRRLTILYVLAAFPLMDLYITPYNMGGLKLFDGIALISGFLLFGKLSRFTNKSFTYTIFAFLLILIIGSLSSPFISNSLISILPILSMVIFAKLLVDELIELEGFTQEVIDYIKMAAIGALLFLSIQLLVGLEFTFYKELNPNINDPEGFRYPGYFSDTQKFAQFLSMTAFLFLIKTKNRILNSLNYFLLFLIFLAITFTGGRAALLGLGFGIMAILIFGEWKYRKYAAIAGVIGLCLYLSFSQHLILFNRAEKVDDSLNFRLLIWKESFDIFLQNPFLGIGTGNFQAYITIYAPHLYWPQLSGEIMYMDHPENGYLKLLTEYGLVAFSLQFYILASLLYYSISKFYKRAQNYNLLFITSSIIGFGISFITVYSLGDKRILITVITLFSLLIYYRLNPSDSYLCPIPNQRSHSI
ncbi:O-antigen ligase family protein [Litoribacter alkaliphilus]|uniref:O-antigen ligase family protein n=1 Tax=Litoribacter ruber TaxID=702568 RepID=A0AAP2CIX0_9BACT|nr:O-antigen ligase family protein [Litoribacter alkaliphilus]MBS9524519.1 O-antigen ligase family protein [Litoribacter alkaliphilus]